MGSQFRRLPGREGLQLGCGHNRSMASSSTENNMTEPRGGPISRPAVDTIQLHLAVLSTGDWSKSYAAAVDHVRRDVYGSLASSLANNGAPRNMSEPDAVDSCCAYRMERTAAGDVELYISTLLPYAALLVVNKAGQAVFAKGTLWRRYAEELLGSGICLLTGADCRASVTVLGATAPVFEVLFTETFDAPEDEPLSA